jgi:hypothetical protein
MKRACNEGRYGALRSGLDTQNNASCFPTPSLTRVCKRELHLQILGRVIDASTIEEDSHTNFGSNFGGSLLTGYAFHRLLRFESPPLKTQQEHHVAILIALPHHHHPWMVKMIGCLHQSSPNSVRPHVYGSPCRFTAIQRNGQVKYDKVRRCFPWLTPVTSYE